MPGVYASRRYGAVRGVRHASYALSLMDSGDVDVLGEDVFEPGAGDVLTPGIEKELGCRLWSSYGEPVPQRGDGLLP